MVIIVFSLIRLQVLTQIWGYAYAEQGAQQSPASPALAVPLALAKPHFQHWRQAPPLALATYTASAAADSLSEILLRFHCNAQVLALSIDSADPD